MPQFNPYPILNPEQYKDRNVGAEFQQGINQGLETLIQAQQQKQAEEAQKRQEAIKLAGLSPYEQQQYLDAIQKVGPEPRKLSFFGRKEQPQPLSVFSQNRERIPPPPNPYSPEAEQADLANAYKTYGSKTANAIATSQDRTFERQKDQLDMIKTQLEIKKAQQELNKPKEGRESMDANLADMADIYKKLSQLNAIPDIRKDSFSNIKAYARSSDLGQAVERALGTEAQSYRNQLNQMKPSIILAIKQAKQLGARGLDSDKEREFYLQAATDEKRDIQSNIQAIRRLSREYGFGKLLNLDMGIDNIPNPYPGYEPGMTQQDPETGEVYQYMLGDPTDKSNWKPLRELNK